MQIKTQLSDCASEFSENVVQKIPEAFNPRQNEMHHHEWMYIQVSSFCKIVHSNKKYRHHHLHSSRHHSHSHEWSLCSVDNFKLKCSLSLYLLVNSFNSIYFEWWKFYSRLLNFNYICCNQWHMIDLQASPVAIFNCKQKPHEQYHYQVMAMIETTTTILMIDKNFIIKITHSHQLKKSLLSSMIVMIMMMMMITTTAVYFYIKLYKVLLLNLFYEYFKSNKNNKNSISNNSRMKIYINPQSINTFCDLNLSTNSDELLTLSITCLTCGIEYKIIIKIIILKVEIKSQASSITTSSLLKNDGLRTLKIFYGILLILRHLICNNYEFSNKYRREDNNNNNENNTTNDPTLLMKQLHAHNQMVLHVTSIRHSHYYYYYYYYYIYHHNLQFKSIDSQPTFSSENEISNHATSNHKLKMSRNHHRQNNHRRNESLKFSNCFHHHHHFHRPTFHRSSSSSTSSNDISMMNAILFFIILFIPLLTTTAAATTNNLKYSTNVIKTKYGPIRGIVLRQNPTVEGYLGVPYATPPLGSLRYMPPVTPSTWKNTRLADHFSPVCPQTVPVSDAGMEALLEMPRGRLAQLRRMKPLLANYSEDCLYLNMYVPREDETGASIEKPMACLVYIAGESYEWNSGNLYDGTVFAAHNKIIVVTINFRLGILGFLKTGTKASSQGNFGLMDMVAALHWLRENLPAFNGNSNMVTLMGHGHGAALANILIVSPVASDLIHRAILISGSALSPWAIQRDPLSIKKKVASDTGCHGDLLDDDIAPCLRKKSISELLAIKLDPPRFLPGFAPFVDGTVIPAITPITMKISIPMGAAIAGIAGIELSDFPTRQLMFAVTSIESYLDFSAQDLEFGFNETRRDRILRTYVRNAYHFHLNEIFSALKNEYTYWEQPPRNQLGSRDAALELLSDGHTVAPLVRLGYLHSLRGGKSYFMHFKHRTNERDFPQRYGTVRGEDVPFCFGLPNSPLFPYNYTQQDIQTSRILIHYLANFIKTGNPNGDATPTNRHSIEFDSLKRLGSDSHLVESLPAPLSLLSSSSSTSSSSSSSSQMLLKQHQITTRLKQGQEELPYHLRLNTSVIFRTIKNDRNSNTDNNNNKNNNNDVDDNDEDRSKNGDRSSNNNDNGQVVEHESMQQQQHQKQSPLIHHALSFTSNRHRRSLKENRDRNSFGSAGSNYKRHLMKRFIVKRNFPNNQLSKSPSDELNEDDSNEMELDGIDDGENDDDYIEREDEKNDLEQHKNNLLSGHHHDRLDVDDNDSDLEKSIVPYWDAYDTVNQLFLEMNTKPEIKNHYRGHKLSMWLSLIPQIHSPGDSPDLSMRHHHFIEENPQFYDGKVRLQRLERPTIIKINAPPLPLTTVTPKHKTEKTPSPLMPSMTTECPSNTTIVPTLAATRPHQNQDSNSNSGGTSNNNNNNNNNNSLFRRLTSNSQYQSYATALTVTIAVGCFLLLLNVFIFAAIYYQREKRATYTKKKEELTEAENNHSSSSPSLEQRYQQKGSRKSSLQSVSGTTFGEYSCYDEKLRCKEKRALVDLCTVELQEYKYSPPCGSATGSIRRRSITPENYGSKHAMIDSTTTTSKQDTFTLLPTYTVPPHQINDSNNLVTYRSVLIPKTELCNQATQADSPTRVHDVSTIVDENDQDLSPIPDIPPPPPRSVLQQQSGILRQGSSSSNNHNAPTTPAATKKRVQIQEISV